MNVSLENQVAVSLGQKPITLVSDNSSISWQGKYVNWLKGETLGRDTFRENISKNLQVAFLALTIIGLRQIRQEFKKQHIQKQFACDKVTIESPPNTPINKSNIRASTHIYEFAIENETIWYRLKNHQSEWSPLYFDGYPEGKKPIEIDADGANLAVLDEDRNVHYRKIHREFTPQQILAKKRIHWIAHRKDIHLDQMDQNSYIAIEKIKKNNWKDKWFSLPVLHILFHLIYPKKLQLPETIKAWSISHRGGYNRYFEDREKQQHLNGVGCTSLDVLDMNEKDIHKYDPWSTTKITIYVPETSRSTFEAKNMHSSGSVMMIIGYEVRRKEKERYGTIKKLKIMTRFSDIDYEGWNPWLKSSHFKNCQDKDVIVLSRPEWRDHPLILADQTSIKDIFKDISIAQIGEGNDARELKVWGYKDGKKGCYIKILNDAYWTFKPEEEMDFEDVKNQVLDLEIDSHDELVTTIRNYKAKKVQFDNLPQIAAKVSLQEFGKRSFFSPLKLELNDQVFDLYLHRKKTLVNYLGVEGDSYELVIPEQYHQEPLLKQAFGDQKVIPVNFHDNFTVFFITSFSFWNKFNFRFTFEQ